MRAVVFQSNGGPEVLEYTEAPDPQPGDGQVVVEVAAAGVNYMDVYEREGRGYGSTPPAVPGAEGAGTVAGTGQRVAWMNVPGSYAERLAAPEELLVPVPDGIDLDVAAASLLQGLTAHYLASDSYPVQPGDWVLVHAGAGGVGLLLIQIVVQRGGRVIATTSGRTRPSWPGVPARRRSSATSPSPSGSARSPEARAWPRSTTASAGRRSPRA